MYISSTVAVSALTQTVMQSLSSTTFWEKLKVTNIFESITSDVLHQLHQGVVKHIVNWIKSVFGTSEIDARCQRLPPNHNLRHFSKGISTLSRITGQEHGDICRILLGLIIGMKLPGNRSPVRLLRAVRSILDFLYLAQLPVHTSETLHHLQTALETFHENKSIFIDLGVRTNFNLPKLHSLQHYVSCIESFGTTDNYNTENTERWHIDFAKDAYRATNRKDEYAQMTLWLQRKEKVLIHQACVNRQLNAPLTAAPTPASTHLDPPQASGPLEPDPHDTPQIHMSKTPSANARFSDLASDYGAADFRQALTVFVAAYNEPSLNRQQLQKAAFRVFLPFQKVPVFHKVKVWNDDPLDHIDGKKALDVIHSHPARAIKKGNKKGGKLPARFDTALINVSAIPGGGITGELYQTYHMQRHLTAIGSRVGQVRVVFKIPPNASEQLFRDRPPPDHLAYIEWFSTFPGAPDPNHGLYKTSRAYYQGKRLSSIVEVSDIRRSIHLLPQFGPAVPREWASTTVLDKCSVFFVNSMSDRHCYLTVY